MFFFSWLYSFITRTIILVKGLNIQLQDEKKHGIDESVGKTIDGYVSLHDDKNEKEVRLAVFLWSDWVLAQY